MLDKGVKYKNIIMKRDMDKKGSIPTPVLPDCFSFRFYQGGDIRHWSRIETSVLEFDSEDKAHDFFQRVFMPYEANLRERCLFACSPDGTPIATTTAWYADSELGHQAILHWVAVCPEYQGLGVGKAIVQKALNVFQNLEPDCPIWLHTQTWSHVAVRLYHSLGFNIVKSEKLASSNTSDGLLKTDPNDFPEYIEILRAVMDDAIVEELLNTAV